MLSSFSARCPSAPTTSSTAATTAPGSSGGRPLGCAPATSNRRVSGRRTTPYTGSATPWLAASAVRFGVGVVVGGRGVGVGGAGLAGLPGVVGVAAATGVGVDGLRGPSRCWTIRRRSRGAKTRSSVARREASPIVSKTSSPSRGAQPRFATRRQVLPSTPLLSAVVDTTAAKPYVATLRALGSAASRAVTPAPSMTTAYRRPRSRTMVPFGFAAGLAGVVGRADRLAGDHQQHQPGEQEPGRGRA